MIPAIRRNVLSIVESLRSPEVGFLQTTVLTRPGSGVVSRWPGQCHASCWTPLLITGSPSGTPTIELANPQRCYF
jgi:hypothetical protein